MANAIRILKILKGNFPGMMLELSRQTLISLISVTFIITYSYPSLYTPSGGKHSVLTALHKLHFNWRGRYGKLSIEARVRTFMQTNKVQLTLSWIVQKCYAEVPA